VKHAPKFLELVTAARRNVSETDVKAIRARQQKGERFLLIDVREESEWAKGHLPGATHLGKGIIERDIEAAVPDADREMVLYCGGGFRSVLAADNLRKMGYTNVVSMDGGYRGWTEAGFPVEAK
jgi:rhodanese-related sulfurtransferase